MKVDIYNTNSYGKRKPCHELKNPKLHEWSVDISEGHGHSFYAIAVCDKCLWGFDLDFGWANDLPNDDTLFKTAEVT